MWDRVARPEQSFYGGEVRGEAVMEYLDEVGSSVYHTYEVYNGGPSTVDYVDVHIEWPAQVQSGGEEGKWLLYMTRPPVVEGEGTALLKAEMFLRMCDIQHLVYTCFVCVFLP